jgi:hypothetical protein
MTVTGAPPIDHLAAGFAEALGLQREPRTAAATAARQRKRVQKLAVDLGLRAEYLPDDMLASLAGTLTRQCLARGIAVPDLR